MKTKRLGTRSSAGIVLLAGLATIPSPVGGQSAEEIIGTALERYAQRVKRIASFSMVQEVMGTESTIHMEKKVVDGFPTFVEVNELSVEAERLEIQRVTLLEGMQEAGLTSASDELAGASDQAFGGFLASAARLGGEELATDIADDAGSAMVRELLMKSALQAGLPALGGALGGATGEQLGQVAGSLAALGDGSILGQLGKIGLGQIKRLLTQRLVGTVARSIGGPLGGQVADAVTGGGAADSGQFGPVGGVPTAAGPLGQGGMVIHIGPGVGQLLGGLLGGGDKADRQIDVGPGAMGLDAFEAMRLVGRSARVAGTEPRGGHDSWILSVDDRETLGLFKAEEFTPTAVRLYIDRELYVLRGVSMEGSVVDQPGTGPVTVDVTLEDYRDVAGMLDPFRTVMAMGGTGMAMSEDERRQLEGGMGEYRTAMAQMEKELAELPAAQRAMVESMMREQMPRMEQVADQFEAMATGQGMEFVVQVLEIEANVARPPALRIWGTEGADPEASPVVGALLSATSLRREGRSSAVASWIVGSHRRFVCHRSRDERTRSLVL
jgi:hypothetical protein